MKILFLDFDGVLNSGKYIQEITKTWTTDQLDPKAVAILNRVVLESSCKIVISSTHRLGNTVEQIIDRLNSYGFIGKVVGVTPYLSFPNRRGNEIQAWLDQHPEVKQFAIVDDDSDMAHLKNKLVKTQFVDGIRPRHVKEIVGKLNEP